MIERVANHQERPNARVESVSAPERSDRSRGEQRRRDVEERDTKDSVRVSAEGRAALEAERRAPEESA